jgi:23S rRNA (pseudouridine1915-N3)-methyltransferase
VKITLLAVGKLKEKHWKQACGEYIKRLGPYANLSIKEIPLADASKGDQDMVRLVESETILRALPDGAHAILLASEGIPHTSESFSKRLDALGSEGKNHIYFIIGGSDGVSEAIRRRASETWSLGNITLPHALARVVFLEQLYRAFKISRNEPYHK